jgi:hypothetical protein
VSEVTALQFRDTLFTAFDTFWAKRTQIAPPNVTFNPDTLPDGETAWVRLYILGDAAGQTRYSNSVARNHFQRSGLFTVGSTSARAWTSTRPTRSPRRSRTSSRSPE